MTDGFRMRVFVPIAMLALSLMPLTASAEWFRHTEDGIMGTRIYVELWTDDKAKADDAIAAVLAEMRHIDDSMSTYKPTSEVSMVNAQAALHPVKITPELFGLIKTALEYSRITDGAFDITYASVGFMYDYRKHEKPTEEQIKQKLPAVNFHHVILDEKNQTVKFTQPGVRIDFGGIAKGYSVDKSIELLQKRGIDHALVTAGGDSRIIGDRFGKPWVIGIQNPDDDSQFFTRIPLVDAAISTSGDYQRFFEEDGVRYHHIIDPHTGHSASKVRSATVISSISATRTDGLSKTAFVLGAEKALEIYNRLDDIDAIIVTPEGKVLYSKGLQAPADKAP
jgi:thiamine biosynthesis lipoprotein